MDETTFPTENDPISLLILLLGSLIIIIPFWFIFGKTGYSKWLSLLMVIPIINLILLYFLAFSKWPSLVALNKKEVLPPPPENFRREDE